MKILNYLFLIFALTFTTLCFAQTADQKTTALSIIAKQINVAVKDVEKELQKEAVNVKVQKVIDDVIERIKRQKVDEVKYGDIITEKEIDDALDAKYDAVSTASVGMFP